MNTELKYRKETLKEFCQKLFNSPPTNLEAHIAYQSRYKPIACYPYTVTTFEIHELEEIQKGCMKLLKGKGQQIVVIVIKLI